MELVYALYVISTSERFLVEKGVTQPLAVWQRRVEGKISRRVNRAQRFRDAIAGNDTIASWENFDEIVASGIDKEKLQTLSKKVFKGYDKWFNERQSQTWDERKD